MKEHGVTIDFSIDYWVKPPSLLVFKFTIDEDGNVVFEEGEDDVTSQD